MSATELLEQVKALPVAERGKLLDAIIALELDEAPAAAGTGKTGRLVWPDIEARSRDNFGDRVFPNPVLLEREEGER